MGVKGLKKWNCNKPRIFNSLPHTLIGMIGGAVVLLDTPHVNIIEELPTKVALLLTLLAVHLRSGTELLTVSGLMGGIEKPRIVV
jgi:hypothetical protein